jgi:hypothetical protein
MKTYTLADALANFTETDSLGQIHPKEQQIPLLYRWKDGTIRDEREPACESNPYIRAYR